MTASTKINFLTLFITCSFLMCKGQGYTDLKDQGYRGPVKIVITKFYSDISYKNKRWVVNDSLNPTTVLSEYYNPQGNFTRKDIKAIYDTSQTEFYYKGGTKSGWAKRNNKGILLEKAEIKYDTPGKFTEIISNLSDSNITELSYFLNATNRTNKLEEISYDSKGAITFHMVSKNEDDRDGKYWKVVSENKLTNESDMFDFTFLAKDKQNNPSTVLVKRNKIVISIRLVSFIYYTEK